MKQIIYIVLFLLSTNFVFAQTKITGSVLTNNKSAIANATISVLNSTESTTTDKNGNFTIQLPNGNYTLAFSFVGYATQLKQITVMSNKAVEIKITLLEQNTQLSEVVVTANKREDNILKVPASITSLSAKKIEDTRTWGLGGLTALVPNYTYQELGVPFQQVQSIRGIQVFSENPAVATYIDDVNNLDILANGFAFTDIERIEVLRGPQGTLFGRNAMGGVVNIITKKTNKQTRNICRIYTGKSWLG
jgi:iron complex outermembrane receptor protein